MEKQLPNNWVEVSFTDIFDINGGTQPPKSQFISEPRDGYIRLLQIRDFGNKPVPTFIPDTGKLRTCEEDDILIARYGASIGRIVTGHKGAYNVALAKVNIPELIEKRFVGLLLKSHIFQNVITSFQRTAQSGFNKNDLKGIHVPLPPLQEQQRIVAKLDGLFGHLEDIKTRLDKVPTLLQNFRQAVLTQAVTGKLTEEWREGKELNSGNDLLKKIKVKRNNQLQEDIAKGKSESKRILKKLEKLEFSIPDENLPNDWAWTCFMESAVKVVDCHNKTAPYVDDGIVLLRTTNIKEGGIKLKGSKFITPETYNFWSKRCPPLPRDILFTREAPMGEAAIIPEGMKVCMGQRMMLIRTFHDLVLPEYLLYNILSFSFQQRMISNAIGTGVKHLRVGDVERLTFPLPSTIEQTEIVKRVEALFSKADAIESQYQNLKEKIGHLPQALLAQAFKGELVAQLPTDGDAKDLLKEIEALKATVKPKTKRKPKTAKA